MKKLQALIKDLRGFDIELEVSQALKKLEGKFLDLQKNQWYNLGQTSDGESMGVYSPSYEQRRRRKGLRTDHVTLKFTGKFYAGLRLELRTDGVYISSTVDYQKYITKRYGNDIFDITDQQRAKIIKDVTDIVLQQFRRKVTN